MPYPKHLLPLTHFKKIEADIAGYSICRKVPDATILAQPINIIPEEILGIEDPNDCFDYSTNLPGVFQLEDNFLELIGDERRYFRSYWDFESVVKEPLERQDFIYNGAIGWFFLPINTIQGFQIPFNRKDNNPPNEIAIAWVVHTPTNSNFWHFSIKWLAGDEFISTTNSKWKNKIVGAVRALLSEYFTLDYQPQELPEEWYIDELG